MTDVPQRSDIQPNMETAPKGRLYLQRLSGFVAPGYPDKRQQAAAERPDSGGYGD
jgi:hypothetical protein